MNNSIVNKLFRVFPHILFWGSFFLIIYLQNPSLKVDASLKLTGLLAIITGVVYLNLYLLIPQYLFTKRYIYYSGFLLIVVLLAAFAITIWFPYQQTGNLPVFIANIVNIIFLLLITGGAKFVSEYFRKMIKIKEIENKQLKAELSLLKAQVHPHFMFNTLNNLYSLIISKRNDDAAGVTLRLADSMRYLLESSKTEKVSIKKESRFLEDYIELEKIRLPRDANASFTVTGFQDDVVIPPMLFIPMVENAFKHGFQSHDANPFALFTLSIQGNEVFFEAENSKGKHKTENKHQGGMGLENLRKRLSILYPQKHLLEIKDEKDTYKITLNISLNP